jgi:hypothetical protein
MHPIGIKVFHLTQLLVLLYFSSHRCKEVDWLPFLTTRFFDSVIAHIRTYREAKNRLNQKTSNEDSAKGMNQNLVATFFELERSGTKKNSRKRISMDPSYEKG